MRNLKSIFRPFPRFLLSHKIVIPEGCYRGSSPYNVVKRRRFPTTDFGNDVNDEVILLSTVHRQILGMPLLIWKIERQKKVGCLSTRPFLFILTQITNYNTTHTQALYTNKGSGANQTTALTSRISTTATAGFALLAAIISATGVLNNIPLMIRITLTTFFGITNSSCCTS